MTAFYMTRMMAMTFYGKARWDDGVHPHESPAVMTIPMIILASARPSPASSCSTPATSRSGWRR